MRINYYQSSYWLISDSHFPFLNIVTVTLVNTLLAKFPDHLCTSVVPEYTWHLLIPSDGGFGAYNPIDVDHTCLDSRSLRLRSREKRDPGGSKKPPATAKKELHRVKEKL